MVGTFHWPDTPTNSNHKTGLCQFIQYQCVRQVLCNTCGGVIEPDDVAKYPEDVTVCECGAPFHWFCHPVKKQDQVLEFEQQDKYTEKDKYEICCHACSSHLATINRKTKVN